MLVNVLSEKYFKNNFFNFINKYVIYIINNKKT